MFFEHLSKKQFTQAFDSLLEMSNSKLDKQKLEKYHKKIDREYVNPDLHRIS